MDAVRKRILAVIRDRNLDLKAVSLEIGKNHAYLQQFIHRGIPAKLPEPVRLRLSEVLGISEDELGAPGRAQMAMGAKAAASDMVEEVDLTAGLGGGGLAMVEREGEMMTFEVIRDLWRLPTWVLNRFNAQSGHIKAFACQGDSMAPTIDDGDVVFADIRHQVPSPPGVYVLADEFGGVVVKRLEVISRPRDETVTVRIMSDNPRHAPRELNLDEIKIVGRYVGRFTT